MLVCQAGGAVGRTSPVGLARNFSSLWSHHGPPQKSTCKRLFPVFKSVLHNLSVRPTPPPQMYGRSGGLEVSRCGRARGGVGKVVCGPPDFPELGYGGGRSLFFRWAARCRARVLIPLKNVPAKLDPLMETFGLGGAATQPKVDNLFLENNFSFGNF